MKHLRIFTFVVLLSLGFAGCKQTNSQENNTPTTQSATASTTSEADALTEGYPSPNVQVMGEVENPFTITVNSLQRLDVKSLQSFDVVCQTGVTTQESQEAKGVLLTDILEKAVIKKEGHKDRNFYIVVRATDGYMATFSWIELFLNNTGKGVYLIYEKNGKPLEETGEMELISNNDEKTGPRHVSWVKSIEVYRVK
ncbi:hypothetical protein HMPREF9075_00863 [Capnocytophaga sp. oral taxon 332 str. F0381]|uniref:molybdopterin-dependent oxidoreductase n=1 Tax=Capnocytophaga sp. oral taxon 332 TaxID=712213 RepID=UPI0002A33038|nr:molybdopterin-dependent oxidoreductase [Capnocytophaga sp. oral taxon 332]EKY10974.1 hypothetical protein HMPREF9075_00863 [Capnocytophaga sp. oral taxon 332 str. F0381]